MLKILTGVVLGMAIQSGLIEKSLRIANRYLDELEARYEDGVEVEVPEEDDL